MAAHSFIQIGDELIFACRESYVQEFAAMYRDSEEVSGNDSSPVYSLPAALLAERLDVLGFTVNKCEQRLDAAFGEHRLYDAELEPFTLWLDGFIDTMNGLSAESSGSRAEDVPEWAAWSSDPRSALRLILSRVDGDVSVSLDIAEVVSRGFASASPTLCADAFVALHANASVFVPRIVMTEGSTDTQFLSEALAILRPHLRGYIRFLDWNLKPEGSASALTRALRAFAAAGLSNEIVALFDNDTAAAEALSTLDLRALPLNFKVVQLPRISTAAAYPTLGPTGLAHLDVNGTAVSIEMFLGDDVLRDATGELTPIQWTGWSAKMKHYQGELTDKGRVQAAFRAKLKAAQTRGGVDPQEDWAGLETVLNLLIKAFA